MPREHAGLPSAQSDRVDAVCEACGGYGVTLYPRYGDRHRTKDVCKGCGGRGHYDKPLRLWKDWTPDDEVLQYIAETPEYNGEPSS